MSDSQHTTNIVIAALGGEGGGTLASWIEEVAHVCGWYAQTTSIAGVAQRTGATIYYIELFPKDAAQEKAPVMSMFPAPGDIDIAISSEISEAGRLIQRGFCSKDRTTLISSAHHVFGITEKVMLADGTIDNQEIAKVAQQQCKKLVSFDMQEIAEQHDTVISASLFGALAGSKALPFEKSVFQDVIAQSPKMRDNNLAAFKSSYNKAITPTLSVEKSTQVSKSESLDAFQLPSASTEEGTNLLTQIENEFPPSCHFVLCLGVEKLIDYQDYRYAQQYLDDLKEVLQLDTSQDNVLCEETARHLALWMAYEDTARVAQLKTRLSRPTKIREEVKAEPEQVLHVTEYFAPRLEELCQPLPAGIARTVLKSNTCRKLSAPFTKGKKFRTDTITTFTLMRMIAATRRWRRSSYSYQDEMTLIDSWLEQVRAYAKSDVNASIEIAKCANIVKGYGSTRERGSQQISRIVTEAARQTVSAETIVRWRNAALEDDEGLTFGRQISVQ